MNTSQHFKAIEKAIFITIKKILILKIPDNLLVTDYLSLKQHKRGETDTMVVKKEESRLARLKMALGCKRVFHYLARA